MPTLTWIGKDKVVNHHHDVPYRVLEHQYGFRAEDDGDRTPTNSGNEIIHGDNLEALKSLLPEYEGRVKCIYIDPPYNTGNEKWVYNDNVNDPKIKKWLGEVVGKQGEDLSRHDKWLCMMYPRLKLLHKLLKDDGAIFISIDDNELANLKLLCDDIFGVNNFIDIFSWHKTYSPSNLSQRTKKCLEYVLCYARNTNATHRFNGLYKVNEADNQLIKTTNQVKKFNWIAVLPFFLKRKATTEITLTAEPNLNWAKLGQIKPASSIAISWSSTSSRWMERLPSRNFCKD